MADVYSYINSSGVVTVDTAVIQTQVEDEYKAAFGSDLIVTANTPQGLLITAEVLARTAVADNNAALANQINPNIAGGVFLDAIMALMGISRVGATRSSVIGTLGGAPGTFIPSGSLVNESVSGVTFESVGDVTISAGGSATVNFTSVDPSTIIVAPNTLTQIVSQVLGWDTCTNAAVGTPGTVEQSDAAARLYRLQTLFSQGSSLANAIAAAVFQVQGVTSLTIVENTAATTQNVPIAGKSAVASMVAHSIYMCIGGTYANQDVAEAITSKKSGGCAYNNNKGGTPISQNVTMAFGGQVIPVLWDTPLAVRILVEVQYSQGTSTIADPVNAIKQAVVDYANGVISGEPGLVVGANVSSFEIGGAINQLVPGVFIHSVGLSLYPLSSYSPTEQVIEVWEQATIAAGDVSVVPV